MKPSDPDTDDIPMCHPASRSNSSYLKIGAEIGLIWLKKIQYWLALLCCGYLGPRQTIELSKIIMDRNLKNQNKLSSSKLSKLGLCKSGARLILG